MLDRYKTNFENLTSEQSAHLALALSLRHPSIPSDQPITWQACENAGLDQADVIMSLSRDTSVVGVQTIEALVGRPITVAPPHMPARRPRPVASRPEKPRTTQQRGTLDLARRIAYVAPNPKKPRTASYDRFSQYREGMTLAEALSAGLTRADLSWDVERGFIRLED